MSDPMKTKPRNPGGLPVRTVLASIFPALEGWSWTVRVERKWSDLWVGAYWRFLASLGYEIDPRFPIRQMKDGTHYQRTHFDLWVCIVPCFPIHLQMWRPW